MGQVVEEFFEDDRGTPWVTPVPIASDIKMECWAQTGLPDDTTPDTSLGAPGGGAYAQKTSVVAAPGAEFTRCFDAAGVYVKSGVTTVVKAAIGQDASGATGGLGGQIADCVGDIKRKGGKGGNANTHTSAGLHDGGGGGGGGGGTETANGADGANGSDGGGGGDGGLDGDGNPSGGDGGDQNPTDSFITAGDGTQPNGAPGGRGYNSNGGATANGSNVGGGLIRFTYEVEEGDDYSWISRDVVPANILAKILYVTGQGYVLTQVQTGASAGSVHLIFMKKGVGKFTGGLL